MARIKPATSQILRAVDQLTPYRARWMSPWCFRVLFSMLHHTSKQDERSIFFRNEPELASLSTDPCGIPLDSAFVEAELRWCPRCLALGYHSSVHQIIGLARCPLHPASPIQRGCPHCKFALPTSLTFLAVDHATPARSCPHCGRDLMRLDGCASWLKSPAFARLESRLLPLTHWIRRVCSGHLHVLRHEPNGTHVFSMHPPSEMMRLALEQLFPLPMQSCFDPVPDNLRVNAVWLDRTARDAPEVTEVEKLDVYRAMLEYFGEQPAPEGWEGRTSVDEVDHRVSDLTEFGYFCQEHGGDGACVSHPKGEVIRPATFKLWAYRLVRDYSAWRRHAQVWHACTIYWTREGNEFAPPAPGTATGFLIELYWAGRSDLQDVAPPLKAPHRRL